MAAILVVVASLYATGVFPARVSSSSSSPYETFDGASPAGTSATARLAGGPWLITFASSVVLPGPTFIPRANLTANLTSLLGRFNCSFAWAPTYPTSIFVPGTPRTAGSGRSAFWLFGLRNASGTIALTTVANGTPTLLGSTTGSECASLGNELTAVAGVVDSPAAVTAAAPYGGAEFLSAHPNATEVWAVFGGITVFGLTSAPSWSIGYTTCTVPVTVGANGSAFNATLNAQTGKVTSWENHSSVSCTPGTLAPLGTLIAPVAPSTAARKAI